MLFWTSLLIAACAFSQLDDDARLQWAVHLHSPELGLADSDLTLLFDGKSCFEAHVDGASCKPLPAQAWRGWQRSCAVLPSPFSYSLEACQEVFAVHCEFGAGSLRYEAWRDGKGIRLLQRENDERHSERVQMRVLKLPERR